MKLLSALNPVLDFFLPAYCQLCMRPIVAAGNSDYPYLCQACSSRLRPIIFLAQDQTSPAIVSFYEYNETASQLLRLYKYCEKFQLAAFFSQLILRSLGSARGDLRDNYDLLVPIPSPRERQHKRGYNHMALIVRALSADLHIPYSLEALALTRQPLAQATLSYARRKKNLTCAFRANDGIVGGKKLLLIDDVTTTGATLKAAGQTLVKAGADEIGAITLFYAKHRRNSV